MGVLFEHDDPSVSDTLKFNGKTVSFNMDYFGTRRITATVRDTKSGHKYHIFISLGHKSADKESTSGISDKSARIIITSLNGQGRLNARLKRFSLNSGYITFDYTQYLGNTGATMTGYISYEPGKKAYVGYKSMTMRKR